MAYERYIKEPILYFKVVPKYHAEIIQYLIDNNYKIEKTYSFVWDSQRDRKTDPKGIAYNIDDNCAISSLMKALSLNPV